MGKSAGEEELGRPPRQGGTGRRTGYQWMLHQFSVARESTRRRETDDIEPNTLQRIAKANIFACYSCAFFFPETENAVVTFYNESL
jgi:hypothetical protein